MSNPPEPTNLSQKFAALQELMTTQHDAVMAEISALRGTGGPETTLRSINQSIWNLAGPAPGAALTDLRQLLSDIKAAWNGGQGLTAYNLLDAHYLLQVQMEGLLSDIKAAWDGGQGLTAYNLLDAHYLLQAQLLEQFNTAVVVPTMKDLMLQIAQQQAQIAANTANPLSVIPVGICETPLVSSHVFNAGISTATTNPITVAGWPSNSSIGASWPDFTTNDDSGGGDISCSDWTKYRIYVASNAPIFGAQFAESSRFPTNQWVMLGGFNTAYFSVDGYDADIKVYICGADAPVLGCAGYSTSQYVDVASWLNLSTFGDMGFLSAGCWLAQLAPVQGGSWLTTGQFTTDGSRVLGGFSVSAQTDVCFSGTIGAGVGPTGLYSCVDGGGMDTGDGIYGQDQGGTFDTTGITRTLNPGYWYVLLVDQRYTNPDTSPDVTVRIRRSGAV